MDTKELSMRCKEYREGFEAGMNYAIEQLQSNMVKKINEALTPRGLPEIREDDNGNS